MINASMLLTSLAKLQDGVAISVRDEKDDSRHELTITSDGGNEVYLNDSEGNRIGRVDEVYGEGLMFNAVKMCVIDAINCRYCNRKISEDEINKITANVFNGDDT